MSPRERDLALKKQRLQMQSTALRSHLAQQTRAFEPAAGAVDMVRLGFSLLRGRPYVWVAAAVTLVVAKPSKVWRWLKRGAVWWRAAQQMRGWAGQLKPVYDAWREASRRG